MAAVTIRRFIGLFLLGKGRTANRPPVDMDQEPSELSYADVKVIVAELRLSIANLEAASTSRPRWAKADARQR